MCPVNSAQFGAAGAASGRGLIPASTRRSSIGSGRSAVLTALIEGVEVSVDQVDFHLRPTGLSALFDAAVTPSLREETVILAVPARLRLAGTEIRMVIDGSDPFASGGLP